MQDVPLPPEAPSLQELRNRGSKVAGEKLNTSLYSLPLLPALIFHDWGLHPDLPSPGPLEPGAENPAAPWQEQPGEGAAGQVGAAEGAQAGADGQPASVSGTPHSEAGQHHIHWGDNGQEEGEDGGEGGRRESGVTDFDLGAQSHRSMSSMASMAASRKERLAGLVPQLGLADIMRGMAEEVSARDAPPVSQHGSGGAGSDLPTYRSDLGLVSALGV